MLSANAALKAKEVPSRTKRKNMKKKGWWPGGCPILVRWLSGSCPMVVGWLFGAYPMVVGWLSDGCPRVAQCPVSQVTGLSHGGPGPTIHGLSLPSVHCPVPTLVPPLPAQTGRTFPVRQICPRHPCHPSHPVPKVFEPEGSVIVA